MNIIVIMGRMCADPELKRTQSQKSVCSFSVAVNRMKQDDPTDFFNVTAWNKTAEFVSSHFRKGQMIAVRGRMQQRKYTDRDGYERQTWDLQADEVWFAGSKPQESATYTEDRYAPPATQTAYPPQQYQQPPQAAPGYYPPPPPTNYQTPPAPPQQPMTEDTDQYTMYPQQAPKAPQTPNDAYAPYYSDDDDLPF